MLRYLSLLLFFGLAFWGCEDEKDTTPPVNKWWEDYKYSSYMDLGSDSLG